MSATELDQLPLAARHDVGVLNGSPLAMGLLVGRDPDTLDPQVRAQIAARDIEAARRFCAWCRQHDLPLVGTVLQFCLRQPGIHCTLTGPKNRAELIENLTTAAAPIPEALWEELAALGLTEPSAR